MWGQERRVLHLGHGFLHDFYFILLRLHSPFWNSSLSSPPPPTTKSLIFIHPISKMEAKINMFFESVGNFFTGGDQIPWCDRDIVAGCEREVAEANKGSSDELKSECLMRLSWALVHSRQPEDVQRGIAMLEALLSNGGNPLQVRERLYLLAVGYYRSGNYSRSRQLVERCLQIAPDWRQALSLKKAIEDRITKDGVIGIGIAATAVGLVAGGLAAAFARKK